MSKPEPFMHLPIKTNAGTLTAVFESHVISCYRDKIVAWFEEKPNIIVEADDVSSAITELHKSLVYMTKYENSKLK